MYGKEELYFGKSIIIKSIIKYMDKLKKTKNKNETALIFKNWGASKAIPRETKNAVKSSTPKSRNILSRIRGLTINDKNINECRMPMR
jgi:hypothetical protein